MSQTAAATETTAPANTWIVRDPWGHGGDVQDIPGARALLFRPAPEPANSRPELSGPRHWGLWAEVLDADDQVIEGRGNHVESESETWDEVAEELEAWYPWAEEIETRGQEPPTPSGADNPLLAVIGGWNPDTESVDTLRDRLRAARERANDLEDDSLSPEGWRAACDHGMPELPLPAGLPAGIRETLAGVSGYPLWAIDRWGYALTGDTADSVEPLLGIIYDSYIEEASVWQAEEWAWAEGVDPEAAADILAQLNA